MGNRRIMRGVWLGKLWRGREIFLGCFEMRRISNIRMDVMFESIIK